MAFLKSSTRIRAQFTSNAFTRVLHEAHIRISMAGRGRALDNIFVERLRRTVKWEDIYPKGYEKIPELHLGLTEYFSFYNSERPHQSLGYRTPDEVHHSGQGGGAVVVDHFSTDEPAALKEACCYATASSGKDLGQRQTAAAGE
jgi:putative transposase